MLLKHHGFSATAVHTSDLSFCLKALESPSFLPGFREIVSWLGFILFYFLSTWHKLHLSGKRNLNGETTSIGLPWGKSEDIFLINC